MKNEDSDHPAQMYTVCSLTRAFIAHTCKVEGKWMFRKNVEPLVHLDSCACTFSMFDNYQNLVSWSLWRTKKCYNHRGELNSHNAVMYMLFFLAHLRRRLRGELLVYQWLRRPSGRRPSVNIFKHLLFWNHWAIWTQISYGDSLGWGNKSLSKWFWSHDQDGRHAHIW